MSSASGQLCTTAIREKVANVVAGGRMKRAVPVTTLFLDVGDVLLTDGWDHLARRRAAKHFELKWPEMEERHALVFETHEEGRMTFQEDRSEERRVGIEC